MTKKQSPILPSEARELSRANDNSHQTALNTAFSCIKQAAKQGKYSAFFSTTLPFPESAKVVLEAMGYKVSQDNGYNTISWEISGNENS